MSFTVLRGRWCNIIVSNVQATSQKKSDDSIDKLVLGIRAGLGKTVKRILKPPIKTG
jgi:hypothetical protein